MEITVVIIGLLIAIGLIGTGIYLAFRLVRFCLRLSQSGSATMDFIDAGANVYFTAIPMANVDDNERFVVRFVAEKIAGRGEVLRKMRELIKDIEYEFEGDSLSTTINNLYKGDIK